MHGLAEMDCTDMSPYVRHAWAARKRPPLRSSHSTGRRPDHRAIWTQGNGNLHRLEFRWQGSPVWVGVGVCASLRGVVTLWDVATGREIRAFKGHKLSVASVAFSADGRSALSGSQDRR